MADKLTFKKVTSPKGSALFCFLDKPNTKFDADGVYQATVVLNAADAQDFLAELDQMAEEAYAHETAELKPGVKKKTVCAKPYTIEEDDEGTETGNVLVKAKMKAIYRDKKSGKVYENAPAVFDAAKQPVETKGLIVGNGSIIRINFTPRPYYVASSNAAGISLNLNAVQVIELRSYRGDAGSYGFDEEGEGLSPADRGPADGEDF